MATKERVAIFLDGSNFYHYLRRLDLRDLLQFDYAKFSSYLARGRKVISAAYYIGKVREEPGNSQSRQLMAAQQRLVGKLTKMGWAIKYGHMLKHHNIYHEKGVDVQIAVDLLRGAYKNYYDIAILVSSDTDLIPAIRELQSEKKQLEYVGFSQQPSYGLIKHSDVLNILKREDLTQFLP